MKQLIDEDARITVTDADLLPDGDATTTYTIRPLTKETHRAITKQHTRKVPNRQTRAMEDVTDWAAVTDALLDYALVGWTNVVKKTPNGDLVPADCTYEHKQALDAVTTQAILERAGLNEIVAPPERREESFRQPAGVR